MNLMGLPLWAWIVFYVLVLLMLVADLKMFGRKGQHEVNVKEALQMTAVWIGVSLVFCAAIWLFYPVEPHEVCASRDGAFLAVQLLQFAHLSYEPVTDVLVFEGDAARCVKQLF